MATKVFRFSLGSPTNPRSGLWRLWTREDEVHVSVQTTQDEVAVTAYPTGRWRIAVGGDVGRWTRPKEFRPGWIRGPDLLIPHTAISIRHPGGDQNPSEPVVWLPPPAPSQVARFTLLFASPRATENPWSPTDVPGTQSVAILSMRTVGNLHLCRRDEPLAPEELTEASKGDPDGSVGFAVIVSADQAGRPSLRESHGVTQD